MGLAKGLFSLRRELYAVGLSSPLSLHLLFFLLLQVIFLLGAIFSLYVRCQHGSGGQKTTPFCTYRIEVILIPISLFIESIYPYIVYFYCDIFIYVIKFMWRGYYLQFK